ncbi:MAG TPA: adenylate/guanylate cyclase domain-containing protein, partial [Candidatus Baltobacteraceae bacterium]|nr:adenylate/guanylate cyclase domain-containing protein [Candidatus Baltobacteraceae bacterium]
MFVEVRAQNDSGTAGRARPSGTVTFLFTDVEGSTERWERDRAAMQEALQRHDALLRDAIEHNRGYVFKTIGDAFCAVFARVEDAVAAALEAQRSLDAADFASVDGMRVRMALHTGTAQERDDDYFGPTVNRVARLLAVGHGGQVLVSGTATELLRAAMLANVRLRDLGQHRLKDLLLPETVSQLEAEGLRTSFPPLRSIQSQPNNLPFALSSLIGRDDDVAEIKRLVGIHRLVTLAGAGGIGKTRAALQVAAELLGSFADGVWFVELAPIADETLIASTIAAALSVRESRGQRVIETLLEHLKNRRTLIVLDNCEHLIAEAASVSADILRTAPQVRLLATSRQGLGLAGEVEYRLPSLAVPALEAQVTAGNAASYG